MSTSKRDIDTVETGSGDFIHSKKLKAERSEEKFGSNDEETLEKNITSAIENSKQSYSAAVNEAEEAAGSAAAGMAENEAARTNEDGQNDADNAIDPILNSHPGSGNNEQRKLFTNHIEQQASAKDVEAAATAAAVVAAAAAGGGREEEEEEEEEEEQKERDEVPSTGASTSKSDPAFLLKLKKLNHKEVERRRRETINNAIRELQDLVPTTHTNKAQIIRKASEYIKKLKEKEENLVNKWTLEKIITDQAISELANSNEKLKSELEKAYRENERFKQNIKSLFGEIKKQSNNSDAVKELISQTEQAFQEPEDEEDVDEEKEAEEESAVAADQEQQENIADDNIDDKLKKSALGSEEASETPMES